MARRIYFDVGPETGLIRVTPVAVEKWDYGLQITLELLETRGAYKKGERMKTSLNYVVYKAPKSRKYPYHQMVRHLSLDEVRAEIERASTKKETKDGSSDR